MKQFLVLIICLFFGAACDSALDVEPEITTTYTNYFKGEKDAAALLYNMNSYLGVYLLQDQIHETVGMVIDEFTQGYGDKRNLAPSAYSGCSWANWYSLIYSTNVLLDNAYRFKDIDAERLEYYKRQACFIKGIAYFNVAKQWGDAPIVPNSTVVDIFAREPVDKVLEEVIRNGEIARDLPNFEDLVDESGAKIRSKQYGCKGAATALLAQAYAWRAGLSGNNEDWKKAEQYCSDIIDGKVGYYNLAATPDEVCKVVMKGNSDEGIFEMEYYMPGDAPFYYHEPYVATDEGYLLGYPVIPGYTPTSYMNCTLYKSTVKNMFEKGDRRLDSYFFKIDSVYKNSRGEEIEIKQAFLYKWNFTVYEYDEMWQMERYKVQNANRVIWRLADIMLLRAECRARLGMSNAADDLNRVRERAYGTRAHDYSPVEGDLRYRIFKEREKELFYEGHRFYDVMRNGYWKTELTKAYSIMSEEEFKRGAQYYPVHKNAFYHNDLMRQNDYWLSKE